jgi:hypothetical protein
MATATGNHGVNDRTAPTRIRVPNKQVVLFTKGTGPDSVLRQIIVQLQPSVSEMVLERVPLGPRVADCFSQRALRQQAGSQHIQPFFNDGPDWRQTPSRCSCCSCR